MILNGILAGLALLSFLLTLWQWLVARRFPLHQRSADLRSGASLEPTNADEPVPRPALPSVTLLKPLKDADEHTEACLRSWFNQDYPGEVQILFGVETASDPACAVVNKLLAEFPQRDAQLVLCPEQIGANAKVTKLAQLEPLAKHELLVVSDADVLASSDLLANIVPPLIPWGQEKSSSGLGEGPIGLVNCFYRIANPTTPAMRWEAVAVNADFWSQVLQSRSLKPLDFALGAAMATHRTLLKNIGGFRALADCIADDYQLGQRIAGRGQRIELCPVVVECWSAPMHWREVWRHQLRWARTIRVCEPWAYFFSILSNATLWPFLWLVANASVSRGNANEKLIVVSVMITAALLLFRGLIALDLERRLTRHRFDLRRLGFVPLKDLCHAAVWAAAFLGSRIEWRGERYRLRRDGTFAKTPT